MSGEPVTHALLFELIRSGHKLTIVVDVSRDLWPVVLVDYDDADETETLEVYETFGDRIELTVGKRALHLDQRSVRVGQCI